MPIFGPGQIIQYSRGRNVVTQLLTAKKADIDKVRKLAA
jgi:hypothetical protein